MLLEQRRLDEAEREYTAYVGCNPTNAIGHLGLGRVVLGRGDAEDAARHLDLGAGGWPPATRPRRRSEPWSTPASATTRRRSAA